MTDSQPIDGDQQWLSARKALMAREKQLTRLRDEVNALRRALPRRPITTEYVFSGKDNELRLADLFGDRTQLVVYHFMFAPDWDAGCKSCSFWADHFDAMLPHLAARDTAFAVVSRAPVAKLAAYADRMGWRFTWVSSTHSSFNDDFVVSFSDEQVESKELVYNFGTVRAYVKEMPGVSVFLRDGHDIFHTYSTYSRGIDMLNGTYQWLDLTPKGRDEEGLESVQSWIRRHDEYDI